MAKTESDSKNMPLISTRKLIDRKKTARFREAAKFYEAAGMNVWEARLRARAETSSPVPNLNKDWSDV